MNVTETKLPGVLIFEPDVFTDDRGYFLETWSLRRYEDAGIRQAFVQDNISFSKKGVLRGLHFQYPHSQGKLVQVLSGEVLDVAVDIRIGSPSFGDWIGVELSEENHRQMFIPEGFAHGFCVKSDSALFSYKCTDFYNTKTECGVIFNDPDINIDWTVAEPVVSPKDAVFLKLKDIPPDKLPVYGDSNGK